MPHLRLSPHSKHGFLNPMSYSTSCEQWPLCPAMMDNYCIDSQSNQRRWPRYWEPQSKALPRRPMPTLPYFCSHSPCCYPFFSHFSNPPGTLFMSRPPPFLPRGTTFKPSSLKKHKFSHFVSCRTATQTKCRWRCSENPKEADDHLICGWRSISDQRKFSGDRERVRSSTSGTELRELRSSVRDVKRGNRQVLSTRWIVRQNSFPEMIMICQQLRGLLPSAMEKSRCCDTGGKGSDEEKFDISTSCNMSPRLFVCPSVCNS